MLELSSALSSAEWQELTNNAMGTVKEVYLQCCKRAMMKTLLCYDN